MAMLDFIIPSNGNAAVRGWLGEWLRACVGPSLFTLWTRYRLQFLPNHFQTSHVSCWWWEEEPGSQSTLALCVQGLVGTIQTSVFAQLLSNLDWIIQSLLLTDRDWIVLPRLSIDRSQLRRPEITVDFIAILQLKKLYFKHIFLL